MKIKPLVWSEETEPNILCRYNHVIAPSPFGRFLITWKGWKDHDAHTIDETPWGGFGGIGHNLDDAKEIAEAEYQERLLSCLENQNE